MIGVAGEWHEHRGTSRLAPRLIALHGYAKMGSIPFKQRVRILGAKEHATYAGYGHDILL
jgi:hypothetical protein